MKAAAFFLPVLMYLVFYLIGGWEFDESALVFIFASYMAVLLIYANLKQKTLTSTEYLGCFVDAIYYEEEWTELDEYEEQKEDEEGQLYTETRYEQTYHPPLYRYSVNISQEVWECKEDFFNYVQANWGSRRYKDRWEDPNIMETGARGGCHYFFNPANCRCIPLALPHEYTNKIKNSYSVFSFKNKPAAGRPMFPHPVNDYGGDTHCILNGTQIEISAETAYAYQLFNAVNAPQAQMRLYVLLFDADLTPDIVDEQKALWDGGEKNEFVVCLGVGRDGRV